MGDRKHDYGNALGAVALINPPTVDRAGLVPHHRDVCRLPLPGGPLKSCATCGARFTSTGPNHRFCSRDCRPCLRPMFPFGRRTCLTCGTMFVRTSYAQRYCSRPCRVSEQEGYPQRKYVERVGRPLKPRGAKPDMPKRAKVQTLRQAGMKLAGIAGVMGVTPSAVSIMLTKIKQEQRTGGGGAERPTRLPA